MNFLAWLELTPLSVWVRESLWGFPVSLIFHSLALALLAGISVATALRILGCGKAMSLQQLHEKTFTPACICLLVCLVSGLLLLMAYPAKALTNYVFYLKLGLIGLGMYLLSRAGNTPENAGQGKWLAIGLLGVWLGVITSGRFLAYTYQVLMASEL